jgi:hypothetical protein
MTSPFTRSRQQAEIAFARVQSQFTAQQSKTEGPDAGAVARAANTLRLKTAREERDQKASSPVRSSARPAVDPMTRV